jgi:hypothetical protein
MIRPKFVGSSAIRCEVLQQWDDLVPRPCLRTQSGDSILLRAAAALMKRAMPIPVGEWVLSMLYSSTLTLMRHWPAPEPVDK